MMRLLAAVRFALRALRRSPLRTVLTMLGLIIGVGAEIAMVGVGNAARTVVAGHIASLGHNVVSVSPGGVMRGGAFSGIGGAGTLCPEDAEAIRREIAGVAYVSSEVRESAQLVAGSANWRTAVLGEGEEYVALRNWRIEEGVMFGPEDVRQAKCVVVLGKTVARGLFGEGPVVGRAIRIRSIPFLVVGVLEGRGANMLGEDQDDLALVPYSTAMRRLFGVNALRRINVGARTEAAVPHVVSEIGALLRQRHGLSEGAADDFVIRTNEMIIRTAGFVTRVLGALLGTIAAVALLVGGVGIMNTMLVSVTERTREIGIRVAVGARRRDIAAQFLVEALTLSAGGGLIGVAAGLGAAVALAQKMGWPTLATPGNVLLAFLTSAVVGIVSGLYPALRAASLRPVDALRYE